MRRLLALLLTALIASTDAAAQLRFEGLLPDDAGFYRIDLPAGWQPGGRLIIYNHGLSMQQPAQVGMPRTAPSSEAAAYWLGQGYALAAGSYTTRGWALFDIQKYQRALLETFRQQAGAPGEILLVGGSLGGLVSLRSAETLLAEGVPVAGVYALCPPAAGARTWDSAVDTRLLYDAVCPEDPLPPGSAHLPWVVDYDTIPSSIDEPEDLDDIQTVLALGSAANRIRQCTGLFQPSWLPVTQQQLAARNRLKQLLGISSDTYLRINLAYSIYVLADLIQAPEKLAQRNPFDNRAVDYGNAEINARVLRVERDPLAAVKLRVQSDFTGALGDAKVLAVHSQRDELVIPEHLSTLSAKLPSAQLATAIVAENTPAHCAFSGAEFRAGFEGLRDWIDSGNKPTPESLRATCEASRAQLGAGQRCGFDPGLSSASFDSKVRPRNLALHQVSRFESGAWFDPASDGEGAIIEVLQGGRHAVVSWYSYPAAGEPGEQTWIIGVGQISDDGIHVAEARQYSGARFGAAFDPEAISGRIWGEFTFWFDGCGSGELRHPDSQGVGRLRYTGPPEYGSGERQLYQLTHNGVFPEHCVQFLVPQVPLAQSRYSGSWFRGPQAPGEGLQLQVDTRGLLLAIWYTYDPQGRPAWLIGTGPVPAEGEPWVITMTRPRGTRFGAGFDPAAVQRHPWGEIRIAFDSCDTAMLRWTSSEAGWEDGAMRIERLTRPEGVAGCGG
jgi:fermentation-respiration switch protein FrsA (DUF1100 family)